ncbi:MAG: Gfo/Idh/MocA family oxidoreductase [Caldilineaceae bacterium]
MGSTGDAASWGWRNDPAKMGGGELIDTGYHPTYRLLFLAGKQPTAVSAMLGTYRLPLAAEDTALASVMFEDGMIGQVFSSWALRRAGGQTSSLLHHGRGRAALG